MATARQVASEAPAVCAAAIIVGVPALYPGWQGLREGKGISLDTVASKLADKINGQWLKEDAVHRINDRHPLSVRAVDLPPQPRQV
jgi:hypothetical protein